MFKRLFYILKQRLYVFNRKNKPCLGKVYMFHEIADKDDIYAISEKGFKQFIEYLNNKHRITNVEDFVNNPDSNNIIITFDDAYSSVYEYAYPLLKQLNIPYYVFICQEYLDKDDYLTRDMIKTMISDSKCVIGSHSTKHELSRFLDRNEMKERLNQSKKALEELTGNNINSFAFPYGSMYAVSDDNINDARNIYDYVFMTYALNYDRNDGKVLPRININESNYKKEMK